MLRVSLSRVTTFTPGSAQEITATFTNTTGAIVQGAAVSLALPAGWLARAPGSAGAAVTFREPIAPGASVSATFTVTSPAATGAGFVTAKARVDERTRRKAVETTTARGAQCPADQDQRGSPRPRPRRNPTNQFIELYNASASAVDLSNWTLINTPSQWAPVTLATIPAGTKLAPGAFYLLGLSSAGLAAPADRGATTIHVRSTTGLRSRPEDRYRRRDPHRRQRRDGGYGHDDGVHSRLDGAVDHDPRRRDQPAGHQRGRLRRRPEDRHRRRRQLRAGDGHGGRQGGHPDDPVGGGGCRRDQHRGGGGRQHHSRRHADGGHRRTQGASRPSPPSAAGIDPGRAADASIMRPASTCPTWGPASASRPRRSCRTERRRGPGARQRHHAGQAAGQQPRIRCAGPWSARRHGGLPGAARRGSGSAAFSPPAAARSPCSTRAVP